MNKEKLKTQLIRIEDQLNEIRLKKGYSGECDFKQENFWEVLTIANAALKLLEDQKPF